MQRWFLCLALCVATAAWADGPRVVILRGDAGGSAPLEYVADETGLANAKLAGVSGAELLALKGQRLLEQADVYRAAQVAAGQAPGPMYIVLEPTGTWAYASPWGTFKYVKDGKTVGPVTTPYLKLGEQMDHQSQVVDASDESTAVNRTLMTKAKEFYFAELKAKGVKRTPDFEKDVLDRLMITIGNAPAQGLSKVADKLTTDRFLAYMQRVMESDLSSYGIDGKARFAAFKQESGADALMAESAKASLTREVAETISHELGHVIQFAALGLYQYKGAAPGIHMNGNTHTLQTLSTPEFALVEGWGEANSMVVVGLPRERTPGDANRINYGTTADYLPKAENDRVGRLVSARLHRDGELKGSDPLTTPPLETDPAKFRAGLHDTAVKAGMSEADWTALSGEVAADGDVQALERARTYVNGLQAKQGQPRSRYDFLRSEYAVANVLARLRESLGLDVMRQVLETMAKHKSKDLAALVEDFVHDHPERRLDTYRVIAQATDGILITPAQVAAVEASPAPLEIDIDQDGHVPGASANAALPQAFPRDMPAPGEEPLRGPAPKGATIAASAPDGAAPDASSAPIAPAAPVAGAVSESVALAPASGERTIPVAVEPEMNGLERN